MRYGVITKVPAPGDPGNLAMGLDVFLDPQATGGTYEDEHKPLGVALGNPLLGIYVQTPVFRLGEILLLDDNDRDQFTRKPSKWSVTCEEFMDIDDAVRRVQEVMKEVMES